MNKAIGDILKEARRKKGLKLPDISTKLCISKTYLRALEGNDKDNLPAQTFTIGFLRTYATHLGLDADEMVHKAKGATPEEIPSVEVNVPEKAHDSTMPSIMVLTVISGALASIITGYSYFAGGAEEEITQYQPQPHEMSASANYISEAQTLNSTVAAPKVTQDGVNEVAPNEVASVEEVAFAKTDKPAKVVELVASAPEIEERVSEELVIEEVERFVEIRAVSDTWMMIVGAENNNLYDNIIHKGESYNAPIGKGLFLTTGNAGGLEFFHSGQQLPVPSGYGTILNALALDQVVLDPDAGNSQQQELLP